MKTRIGFFPVVSYSSIRPLFIFRDHSRSKTQRFRVKSIILVLPNQPPGIAISPLVSAVYVDPSDAVLRARDICLKLEAAGKTGAIKRPQNLKIF